MGKHHCCPPPYMQKACQLTEWQENCRHAMKVAGKEKPQYGTNSNTGGNNMNKNIYRALTLRVTSLPP
jgi:hypothetical protein